MPWTNEQKVQALLRLPWTIEPKMTEDGERILRCREIPAATGAGDTDTERVTDFWQSLRAALECYVHFDDPIPLPKGSGLPWTVVPLRPPRIVTVALRRGDAWPATAGSPVAVTPGAPSGDATG